MRIMHSNSASRLPSRFFPHPRRLCTALLGSGAAAVLLTGALAGCSATGSEASSPSGAGATADEVTQQLGFEGMDARQIIDKLDRTPVSERSQDFMASVGTDELKLTTEASTATLPLPEDLNYVSIAPYESSTHDCFYHSLTTCRGELGDQPVHVTVTDNSGKKILDQDATTFNNGFVSFWLPEDITGKIAVTHDGKSGTTAIDTTDQGATCITDLKLA